jgi:hypothetical protein
MDFLRPRRSNRCKAIASRLERSNKSFLGATAHDLSTSGGTSGNAGENPDTRVVQLAMKCCFQKLSVSLETLRSEGLLGPG